MEEALEQGSSLIIFPEGTRTLDEDAEMGEFKPGLWHLAKKHPQVELVPVHLENLNRILPKGDYLLIPLLAAVTFGRRLRLRTAKRRWRFWQGQKRRWRNSRKGRRDDFDSIIKPSRWSVASEGSCLVASAVGAVLKLTVRSDSGRRTVANLNARIRAWWIMVVIFGAAIAFGRTTSCILFMLISFLALREMVTLAPTRRADHHTLFWAFFVIIPIQYYFVWSRWYGMFAIFIPVYCFLFLAIRSTLAGDPTRYIERAAKIQWGVMICVYCISHAPALLMLQLKDGHDAWKLLAFLVIVVQMSDVLQYCWGKTLGKHKIAPHLSPNKTIEGFIGGVLSASLLGVAMYRMTPFTMIEAALISLAIAIMGFFGGLVMSAIKRDAGIKDFGHLIAGHGGILDRVDSLCFAAPVFFHIVRYWFAKT